MASKCQTVKVPESGIPNLEILQGNVVINQPVPCITFPGKGANEDNE